MESSASFRSMREGARIDSFRLDSGGHAQRIDSSINLKIWRYLDSYELYHYLEFERRHKCGSQRAESAKVDFDNVLIDSASAVRLVKIQTNSL